MVPDLRQLCNALAIGFGSAKAFAATASPHARSVQSFDHLCALGHRTTREFQSKITGNGASAYVKLKPDIRGALRS